MITIDELKDFIKTMEQLDIKFVDFYCENSKLEFNCLCIDTSLEYEIGVVASEENEWPYKTQLELKNKYTANIQFTYK